MEGGAAAAAAAAAAAPPAGAPAGAGGEQGAAVPGKKKVSAAVVVKDLKERIRSQDGKLKAQREVNSALQRENESLREQLAKAAEAPAPPASGSRRAADARGGANGEAPGGGADREQELLDLEDHIDELKKEFAARLASAETAVSLVQGERDELRKSLREMESERKKLGAKDQMIEDLRAEGEALSVQVGEKEGAVRRLRAELKEKGLECDAYAERCAGLEGSLQEARELEAGLRKEAETLKEWMRERRSEEESGMMRVEKLESSAQSDRASLEASMLRERALNEVIEELRASVMEATKEGARIEEGLRRELAESEGARREAESMRERAQSESAGTAGNLLKQVEAMAAQREEALAHAEAAEERLREVTLECRREASEHRARAEHTAGEEKRLREAAAASDAETRAARDEAADLLRRLGEAEAALREALSGADEMREAARGKEAEIGELRDAVGGVKRELESARRSLADQEYRCRKLAEERDSALAASASAPAPAPAPAAAAAAGGGGYRPMQGFGGFSSAAGDAPGAGAAADAARLAARMDALSKERDQLVAALTRAEEGLERVSADASSVPQLRRRLGDMENKLMTALEMLGERNERVEQLQMDIEEARGIYRDQISTMADVINKLQSDAAGQRAA